MTENTVLNLGTGGDVIAADEIAGVKYQRNKIIIGNDGVSEGDVSSTNPMPIFTPAINPTDISGSITTGKVAQVLVTSNSSRRGWWLRNNSDASLWIDDITTAIQDQPSLEIKRGEMYETPANGCSSNQLSIIGNDTGQTFTAREF